MKTNSRKNSNLVKNNFGNSHKEIKTDGINLGNTSPNVPVTTQNSNSNPGPATKSINCLEDYERFKPVNRLKIDIVNDVDDYIINARPKTPPNHPINIYNFSKEKDKQYTPDGFARPKSSYNCGPKGQHEKVKTEEHKPQTPLTRPNTSDPSSVSPFNFTKPQNSELNSTTKKYQITNLNSRDKEGSDHTQEPNTKPVRPSTAENKSTKLKPSKPKTPHHGQSKVCQEFWDSSPWGSPERTTHNQQVNQNYDFYSQTRSAKKGEHYKTDINLTLNDREWNSNSNQYQPLNIPDILFYNQHVPKKSFNHK
jgi:hypothetical protein